MGGLTRLIKIKTRIIYRRTSPPPDNRGKIRCEITTTKTVKCHQVIVFSNFRPYGKTDVLAYVSGVSQHQQHSGTKPITETLLAIHPPSLRHSDGFLQLLPYPRPGKQESSWARWWSGQGAKSGRARRAVSSGIYQVCSSFITGSFRRCYFISFQVDSSPGERFPGCRGGRHWQRDRDNVD